MYNSTLIQLFKSLDRNDRRQLRKFVRSPYFNTREDVITLFDYIDKHIDTGGAPKMAKEKAFSHVYKKQPFDVDMFYYPMSYLTQLILKYLAINELENDTPQYQHLLYHSLRQRGVNKMAEKIASDAYFVLEKQTLRDARYHYNSFQLRKESFNSKQRMKHDGDFELQETINDFHFFTMSEVLNLAYSTKSYQSVAKKIYVEPLLESVLSIAEQYLHIPAVAVHYYAYKTQSGTDTNGIFFQLLKKEITENQALFSKRELSDIWFVALNYCIRRQNQGELEYAHQALDLYRQGLDNRVLMENDVLSPYTYHNAVQLAMKVNNYDWAQQFMGDFQQFLPEKERDNIVKYLFAIFHFRKNDFEKAMTLLQEVNLKEVVFNLDSRRLLARIYFQLQEYLALDSHIESSKIYLHRQKDIGYHKEMYSNFFKYLEKLLKLNHSNEDKQKLHEEINNTKLVAEKDWLLQQTK